MRRSLIALMVLVLVVSSISVVSAGGRHRGSHHNGALWWGIGSGVVLGTLGILAARPYYPRLQPYPPYPAYPAYPPVVIPQPRMVTHLYCPVYQAYYPYVPQCPVPWVQVLMPY
jgi:hypothetical protein